MKRHSVTVLVTAALVCGIALASYRQSALAVSQAEQRCPPLPAPSGTVIPVSTVSELKNAVAGAGPGSTILVADGTYDLDGVFLRFDTPRVTLRSASGDRGAVVFDGNYITAEIAQIVASDVTIADVTLREAYYHPIHVMSSDAGHTTNTLIYNVHIVDPGEQAIKINPTADGYYPDDGVIACSQIELTDAGRSHIRNSCYTGGVDAHQARGWVVRDNLIEGFWCENGLSEHGIHFWHGCRDTLVERNELRDNARGIGFGLATSGDARTYADDACPSANGGYVDHYGGTIRNNFVSASREALFASEYGFDCGICLWQACGAKVLHNSVASTQAPFSSIEWRFDHTDIDLVNNLATHNLRDRGGTARLSGNLEHQPLSLFVDAPAGDLHLVASAAQALDRGVALPAGLCDDDVDGDTRPIGDAADIGADEYGMPRPHRVKDLRVENAIVGSALTATLRWTVPSAALTTTIRYAGEPLAEVDWYDALPLAEDLTGSTGLFTATVPYGGSTVFFALKTQNAAGDWSALSNNAFWPVRLVYLPLTTR
jgi:hypothetical protein